LSIYLTYKKNKGVNRQSLDIVRDVLSVASAKARKTRIMYQANLSYLQVQKYLQYLLKNGLLDRDGDSFYVITSKGLDFLKLYQEYVRRCRLIKEQLDSSARERMLLESMCSDQRFDGDGT
jgi:predicted transcriptional regulator